MGARRIGWRAAALALGVGACAGTPALRERAATPGTATTSSAVRVAVVAPGGVLPAGARLPARLNQNIGTREAIGPGRFADATRPGAPFTATLTAPIVDERGRLLVPAGAEVAGRVGAMARGKPGEPARIELAPERLRAGRLERRLDDAAIDAAVEQLPGGDTGTQVISAAFAATVFGGLFFGIPGVLIGYGFGGLGGAAAVTPRSDGWIAAGAPLTVELRAPVPLGAPFPRRASR